MPSLSEVQAALADALIRETPPAALQGPQLPAFLDESGPAGGLEVYANAVRQNYRAALAAVYPAVKRLVGGHFFSLLVARFTAAFPSRSGDLHDFGSELADFMAGESVLQTLPYLPDVARLEWALHRAFHAHDDALLTIERLAAMDREASGAMRLRLHASAHLIRSAYPIVAIWCANQTPDHPERTVELDRGAECALVIRRGMSTLVEALTPAEYAMLDALDAGATLAAALEQCMEHDEAFDLAGFLARHVPAGTFALDD